MALLPISEPAQVGSFSVCGYAGDGVRRLHVGGSGSVNVSRLIVAGVATAALCLMGASPALADSGSVIDAKGDYPDIVKLAYRNGASSVAMTMTYASSADAQNESFYLHWGTAGKRYQVFESRSAGIRELRFYSGSNAAARPVTCAGLRVVHRDAYEATKVVIPRSCITKAANALRFQGVATAGLSSSDETKKSPRTARG